MTVTVTITGVHVAHTSQVKAVQYSLLCNSVFRFSAFRILVTPLNMVIDSGHFISSAFHSSVYSVLSNSVLYYSAYL